MSRITTFQGFFTNNNSWKSETPLNKTGFVNSNAPTNIKPLGDNENRSAPFGKPRPLPIYRKGRRVRQVASSKVSIKESLENPGGYVSNNLKTADELCYECNGAPLVNNYGNKVVLSNNPLTNDQCFSQEKFALQRMRAAKFNVQKSYHTRHEELRKKRGAVHKSNIHYSNCGDCVDVDTPTNAKYHVNGAVTAGARLDRLKLEAVEKTGTRFVGDYKEPYNQKTKTESENCDTGRNCIKYRRIRKL